MATFLAFLASLISEAMQALGPAIVQTVADRASKPSTAVMAHPNEDLNSLLDEEIQADIDAGRTPPADTGTPGLR